MGFKPMPPRYFIGTTKVPLFCELVRLTVTVSLTPFETAVPLSPKAIRSVNVDTFK